MRGLRELLGEHRAALVERAQGLARRASQGALVRRGSLAAGEAGEAGERGPRVDLVARDEAHRGAPHGARGAPPEPPPRDLAREGDLVEPLALVPADARRQHARLPGGRRHLEAGELAHDRGHAPRPLELVLLVHVLPGDEKSQEIGRGDGLDLPAKAVEGVAVDARQQAAVAPALAPLAVGVETEAPAKDGAFVLELEHEGVVARDGPQRLETAAQDVDRLARSLDREPAIVRRSVDDDAARRLQLGEPGAPGRRLVGRHVPHPEQRLVDLVGARGRRPCLLAHAPDRFGVERSQLVGALDAEGTAGEHRLRAALLERRVVEEGVGLRGEDPGGERRRLGRVDRATLDPPVAKPPQDVEEAVDVHRLVQTVLDGLANDGVVDRHLDVARREGLAAGHHVGEGLDEQVVGPHSHQGGRRALAAAHAVDEERARHVPPPPGLEHGGGEERLHEQVARRLRVQVVEHLFEREAVHRPEGEDDRLLVGRGLKLEAERTAEPLAQGEAPRPVDPPPERGVQHELHPTALVEEALEHDALLRRYAAEDAGAGHGVLDELTGGGLAEALVDQGVGGAADVYRQPRARPRSRRRARPSSPALRRARREYSAGRPSRRPRAPRHPRRAGSATRPSRAGTRRRRSTRSRSPRSGSR